MGIALRIRRVTKRKMAPARVNDVPAWADDEVRLKWFITALLLTYPIPGRGQFIVDFKALTR